jgi:hypothetical protein
MSLYAQVDHLVVAAASLEEGVRWCEHTLGISPGPGGQHALMGTHNRLFKIAGARCAQAYFEIIAIDPQAPAPARRRWFDLDEPRLQQSIAQSGPQLVHFVASVPDIQASVKALYPLAIERGVILPASRQTPGGLLQWQISVRDDGQRLFDGCLPSLIQWGDTHPVSSMPSSGVELLALKVAHPQSRSLSNAYQALGLQGVAVDPGPAQLIARLATPLGEREIHSIVH